MAKVKARRILAMHIDVAAAGLLAQVIPTLLIFLALEAKLSINKKGGILHKLNLLIRVAAIFINTGTTFICLWSVMKNSTTWTVLPEVVDALILIGFLLLYVAILGAMNDLVSRGIRKNEQ